MSQSLAVRAYVRALKVRTRFLHRVTLEFDGLWLGLLSPEAIAEFDATYYSQTREFFAGRRARYVDADWNDQGFFGWEGDVIAEHMPPPRRVIVTSAGAGREVLALMNAGYDAVGYEPNADLVRGGSELLASRGYPGRLHISPRDVFPPDAPEADAVIVGWGAYTNMTPQRTRVAFLRQVHGHLAPGGRALVSFFSRSEEDTYHAQIAARAAVVRRLRRLPPPEVGDALQPNFVHRYALSEALAEMRSAGFEVIVSAAQPYGHAVLEKPA
jgi:hypothetical protein